MMGARRGGYSFIEMLFSLVILAIVSGGVFTLFYSNNFGANLSGDQSSAMADAETGLQSLAIDLRPGTAFAAPANTGGIRATLPDGTPIEYYQSGTRLYRLVAGTTPATTTVLTDLAAGTGLTLKYYDNGMNLLSGTITYSQVAAVDVTLTVALAHSSLGQVTRTTRVVLRNKVS